MTDTIAPAPGVDWPDGLPTPRRYFAIAAIGLAIVAAVLDSTIANVALPTIARDLHADAASSIWVVNAYQIAVVMCLLPFAALGEIVGYRRVSQTGLIVFTIASLACAMSNSLLTLTLARVLQGLGAAGIMSVNGALVRFTYPQHMLGRAIGINTVIVSIASAVGPTIASAILSVGDWRWLFGINVPFGCAAAVMAWLSLPASPLTPRRFNLVGAGLNAAAFGLIISGVQALTHGGVGQGLGVAELALGALAAYTLYRHERDSAHPLVPLDLLRIRLFRLSVATSIASFAAQMLALVALPFELQRLGYSAVDTGLLMTPWPLAVAVAAPIAGHLADRYPAGILGGIGLVTLGIGLFSLATLPAGHNVLDLTWRMALCGLGFGTFQTPNNRAMLGSAPRERSGAAGGMLGTARLTGQSLGAASAALLFHIYGQGGSLAALYLAAGFAIAAAGVSMLRIVEGERPAPAPTDPSSLGPD